MPYHADYAPTKIAIFFPPGIFLKRIPRTSKHDRRSHLKENLADTESDDADSISRRTTSDATPSLVASSRISTPTLPHV